MRERHALVVDDSKVGRITMQKKLESIGFRVDMAESGHQALEYLAHHRPDMIFMDHMMPDMDGFEATRQIKALPAIRDIPVIIISGNDDEDFVQQARVAGALHAISKPPGPGVLEAILETLPPAESVPESAQATGAAPVAPPPTPTADAARISETVERLVGEAMASLGGNLLAEARKQVEAELESTRGLLQHWGGQLDEARATLAGFLGNALNPENVRQQFAQLEQRLRAMEAAPGPSTPDAEAIRQQVEQGLSARHEQLAQGLSALDATLNALSGEVHRLAAEVQAAKTGHDQRLDSVEQRVQAALTVERTPAVEEAALLAAVDERIAPRLEALRQEIQARAEAAPATSTHATQGASMEALFQEELASLRAEVEAQRAGVEAIAQTQHACLAEIAAMREALDAARSPLPAAMTASGPATAAIPAQAAEMLQAPTAEAGGCGPLQAEIEHLKARLKTLTVALGVGGAVLAAAVAAALLR